MDPQYKSMYQEARSLQHRLQDWMDDHKHPMADKMKQQMRSLQDDMETSRSPRNIEQRLKDMERQIEQLGHGDAPGMSAHHVDDMRKSFEEMRMDLRKFKNY